MIKLSQNSTNNVILTLSESVIVTDSNPIYFLFRFYNLTTHDEKLFTATDLSTNIVRYNQFNITVTGKTYENLTGGTISLQPDGEYYYEVYQQSTPHNLLLSNVSGTYIENGLVQLKGTDLDIIDRSYSGTTNNYIGYEPN